MTEENRRSAILLEVRAAERAYESARALRSLELFNDSLSRLYYALFHYVSALLLTEGLEARRHSAIPGLLGQHFVLRGLLTAEDVATFSRSEGYRSLADYERTWEATPGVCDRAFQEIDPLIARIKLLLREGGWLEK